VNLPAERRGDNVAGAFETPFAAALEGKTVTLVDDVATTGATLRACVEVLQKAGAARVTAVVAAIS
jgi:predicted amidophosphoribosyltransferase